MHEQCSLSRSARARGEEGDTDLRVSTSIGGQPTRARSRGRGIMQIRGPGRSAHARAEPRDV